MSKFFLPYQEKWITQDSRYSIYLKSRQIGITFAEAYWSFRRRLTTKIDHIFCSANFKTSQEFIRYVKLFAQATNLTLQYTIINEDSFQNESVTFPNGSRIIIVSSNPTALRGFRGDVTWDEAAFHDHADEFFTAALPVTTWGGHFHIISTHHGAGTVFDNILKKAETKENNFRVFKTTLQDAVNDGLADKIDGPHKLITDPIKRAEEYINTQRINALSAAMFDQEYMCIAVGTESLIKPIEYERNIMPIDKYKPSRTHQFNIDITKCNDLYMGVDPARTHDNTAIYILEQGTDKTQKNPKLSRVYRTVNVIYLKNQQFSTQFETLCTLMKNHKIRKCIIECNGIGSQLAEQLELTFPGRVVQQYTNAQNKERMCQRVKGWVNQDRITLCPDEDVKTDILSMQRIVKDGKNKYEGRTGTSHADAFMGLALALQAAEGDNEFFDFHKA